LTNQRGDGNDDGKPVNSLMFLTRVKFDYRYAVVREESVDRENVYVQRGRENIKMT
jgi:hypothetical protein